jgi:hypothetical protein
MSPRHHPLTLLIVGFTQAVLSYIRQVAEAIAMVVWQELLPLIVQDYAPNQETEMQLIPAIRPTDPGTFLAQHMDLANSEVSGTGRLRALSGGATSAVPLRHWWDDVECSD